MEKLFQVSIVTPDKVVYEGEISSLIAPGEAGYLGILADHAPLVASLVSGKITMKESSGSVKIIESKEKGFLEVMKNRATILLDNA